MGVEKVSFIFANFRKCKKFVSVEVVTFPRGSVMQAFAVGLKGKGHPCTGTEALYRPYGP